MGFPLPVLLVVSVVAAGGYGAWRLSTQARKG
jgi:hypothetical protein